MKAFSSRDDRYSSVPAKSLIRFEVSNSLPRDQAPDS